MQPPSASDVRDPRADGLELMRLSYAVIAAHHAGDKAAVERLMRAHGEHYERIKSKVRSDAAYHRGYLEALRGGA
jgi:hypothetical protein